jgi:hypothetical protein
LLHDAATARWTEHGRQYASIVEEGATSCRAVTHQQLLNRGELAFGEEGAMVYADLRRHYHL